MEKYLVVIPTVNERLSLPKMVQAVLKHDGFHVLVVDDASTDGTPEWVKEIISSTDRVSLIERPSKLGLGTAYITGFKWGIQRGFRYFIEMDADGSHNPDALPWFIKEIEEGVGLLIGSRYMNGSISVVGWDFRRLLLSKCGNLYASLLLGIGLTDMTSGFRCYSVQALQAIDLDGVHSTGYSFQIEMAYRVDAAGFKVHEMPIIFYERNYGSSKMSKRIVREAAILPWRLRIERLSGAVARTLFRKKYVKEISG